MWYWDLLSFLYVYIADIEGLMVPSKEGLYTQAVMLKWCTPKSSVVGKVGWKFMVWIIKFHLNNETSIKSLTFLLLIDCF